MQSLQRTLSSETTYQVVMVAAMLELLLLGALLPRTPDSGAPVCFAAVAGLRLLALLTLAGVLGTQRDTVRDPVHCTAEPLGALIALSIWGAILAPPELWAAAAELRVGLPVTLISSVALSGGFYAALRLHPAIGWGFLGLIFSALFVQHWQLEPLGGALSAVIALGVGLCAGLWLLTFRTGRSKIGQGDPA